MRKRRIRFLSLLLAGALLLGQIGYVQAEEPVDDQTEVIQQEEEPKEEETKTEEIKAEEKKEEQKIEDSSEKEEVKKSETTVQEDKQTNDKQLARSVPEADKKAKTGCAVTATLRVDGYGYLAIPPTSVTLPDTYKTLEEYGLTGVTDPGYYTVLHMLAQYCVDNGKNPAEQIELGAWGFNDFMGIGSGQGTFIMFEVNDTYPASGEGVGYTIENCPVKSGDNVVLYDWYWSTTSVYAYFSESQISVGAGESFSLRLLANDGMGGNGNASGATIILQDSNGNVVTDTDRYIVSGVTDSEGRVEMSIMEPGTYTVTAERKSAAGNHEMNRPYAQITVGAGQSLSDEESVATAKGLLDIGFASIEENNITLPLKSSGGYGTEVSWKTKDEDKQYVLSVSGNRYSFMRPIDEDVTITFVAQITKNQVADTKEFPITLKGRTTKLDELNVNYGTLNFNPDKRTYTLYVPLEDEDGSSIEKIKVEAVANKDAAFIKIDDGFCWTGEKEIELTKDPQTIKIEVNTGGVLGEPYIITVKRAANQGDPLEDLPDIEWGAHLGSDSNNAVVDAASATEMSKLAWESFSNGEDSWGSVYAGTPILLNGCIYAARNNKLEALDAKTGEVKMSAPLAETLGFYSNIVYGGGMIFVPLGNGQVQAFNAATLESLFLTEYFIHPGAGTYYVYGAIHYKDGKVYVGYSDYSNGFYAAFDTVDLDKDNEEEIVSALWKSTREASYYGSGAVTIGGYVVIAGDDGVLAVLDTDTGEEVSSIDLQGMVRGSIVYTDGYLWTATQGGDIYKIALADDGQVEIKASEKLPLGTSSSPVVTGGKVYITGGTFNDGGYLAVYDMDLKMLTSEKVSGIANTPTVTTAYDDTYVYFTENAEEGALYVAKVSGNNKITMTKLYVPEHAQYSMSKVLIGADGTIYYSNDAGYLYALKEAEADDIEEPKKEDPEKDDEEDDQTKTVENTIYQNTVLTPRTTSMRTTNKNTTTTKKSESQNIADRIKSLSADGKQSLTITNPPEYLEPEVFAELKEHPDFQLIIDRENYTISMKGSDVTNTSGILRTVLVEKETDLSEEEQGRFQALQQLELQQEGEFPGNITIVYALPSQLQQAEALTLYSRSDLENGESAIVQKGYAMFTLGNPGEYVLAQGVEAQLVKSADEEIPTALISSTDNGQGNGMHWWMLVVGIIAGAAAGGVGTYAVAGRRKKENTWEEE